MLSKNTLFEFLYQNLHDQITCGHLKPGDTLPSMPQLAAIYNVGIRTVKDVLARLKNRRPDPNDRTQTGTCHLPG